MAMQRLPKDANALSDFPAKLYNAPVTPLRRLHERSLDGVVINNIHLMRTGQYASSVCEIKQSGVQSSDPLKSNLETYRRYQ